MPGEIVYPNAHVVEPAKGDKKRGDRLRAAVDELVRVGKADPAGVAFISSRFWIANRDGQPCYVHMDGDNLEWLPIAAPGLLAKDGTIHISPEKKLELADSDFMAIRPLVNKYRKLSVR